MEGTFDFDAAGFAHVVSAPGWSSEALRLVQREMEPAARALADVNYSDQRAYALLEKKLDAMVEKIDALHDGSRDNAQRLARKLREQNAKTPRRKFLLVLAGIAFVAGQIADFGGAYQISVAVIQGVVAQIEAHAESTGSPYPLPRLPPLPPRQNPPTDSPADGPR